MIKYIQIIQDKALRIWLTVGVKNRTFITKTVRTSSTFNHYKFTFLSHTLRKMLDSLLTIQLMSSSSLSVKIKDHLYSSRGLRKFMHII
jgi:hypothetical protein